MVQRGDVMQIKKADMKETILNTARDEFLKKGYDNASMRIIAKKAHTTLGNIYHYYPSKEAILDELMIGCMKEVNEFIDNHLSANIIITDMDELLDAINQLDKDENYLSMKALLSKEFAILIDIKQGKYKKYRDEFILTFQSHLAVHLNVKDPNDYLVCIITKAAIECLTCIVRNNSKKEKAKKDFIRFFKMICTGLVISREDI